MDFKHSSGEESPNSSDGRRGWLQEQLSQHQQLVSRSIQHFQLLAQVPVLLPSAANWDL